MPKKLDQTIMGAPKGDCFRTCVAMLLESNLTVEEVPNFVDPDYCGPLGKGWFEAAQEWCLKHGMFLECEDAKVVNGIFWTPDKFWIAGGTGPRGLGHCVVMENTELWHDPHPSREGLDLKKLDNVYTLTNMRSLLRRVFPKCF